MSSAQGRYKTVIVREDGSELMTSTPAGGAEGDASQLFPVLARGDIFILTGVRFTVVRHELSVSLDGLTQLTIVVARA
jgi:hypothetical protein